MVGVLSRFAVESVWGQISPEHRKGSCLLSVQLPKVIGGQSSSKNEHGIAAAASLLQDSFQALTANPPLVSLLLQLLLLVNVLFLNKPLYGGGRKQSNHQACQQLSSRGFASAEQQKCWAGLGPPWPTKHKTAAGSAILPLHVLSPAQCTHTQSLSWDSKQGHHGQTGPAGPASLALGSQHQGRLALQSDHYLVIH